MSKFFAVFFVLSAMTAASTALSQSTLGNTEVLETGGSYAEIETELAARTIKALTGKSGKQRDAAIHEVEASPENYQPHVLYGLSNVLFENGRKDDGAFYFYAGQLRARFDANRCADITARQAVSILNNNYGSAINEYTFQDLQKLEALIRRVVDWDRSTPHKYDHRWINLHGMGAFTSDQDSKPLSLPEEEWPEIAEKTRSDYLESFLRYLSSLETE